ELTDYMRQIKLSNSQQASEIDQINEALVQMDSNTTENANLVDRTASTAKSLNSKAMELSRSVEFFKTNHYLSSIQKSKISASR
ncbi:MAG: hypothetical protein AAF420_14755, partial [Pseudomonadota bacterium]